MENLKCATDWVIVDNGYEPGVGADRDSGQAEIKARDMAMKAATDVVTDILKDYSCDPPCTLRWAITFSDPDPAAFPPISANLQPLHIKVSPHGLQQADRYAAFGYVAWTLEVACLERIAQTPHHGRPVPRPE